MKGRIFYVFVAILVTSGFLVGQSHIWTGGGADDNWDTAANWTPGVPGVGAHVRIATPGTTVHVNVDVTVASIINLGISGSEGHLEIDAGVTLTTTQRGVASYNGNSTLTINGTLDATAFSAGYPGINLNAGGAVTIGSNGIVNIDGPTVIGIQVSNSGTIDNQGTINLKNISGVGIYVISGSMTNSGEIVLEGTIGNLFALRGDISSTGTISGFSTDVTSTINNDVGLDGGTLSPGMSVGQLSFRSGFAPTAAIAYEAEIDKGAGESDELFFFNSGAIANDISNLDVVVSQLDATPLTIGDEFTLVRSQFGYSNTFNSIDYSAVTIPGGSEWQEEYTTGNDATVKIKLVASLPVDLVSLCVENNDDRMNLKWQTASEYNNEGFQIERSTDGKDFKSIGFTEGNGNTNKNVTYEFIDEKPMTGNNYYRLKQMDFDGKYQYSKTVSIELEKAIDAINFYPNPAKDLIHLENVNTSEPIQITIYNEMGILVSKITTQNDYVDTSKLPIGTYTLNISSNTINHSARFIKN